MSELVYLDKDGKELQRETKGKGRPPLGSVRGEDGNFYVHPVDKTHKKSYYVDLDHKGDVISRVQKGRGRTRKGYDQHADGDWYKTVPVEA